MLFKENFKKMLKITGIIIFIIFLAFIISTSVIALTTPKNINIDDFINCVYVSKDSEHTLKIVDNENIVLSAGKKMQKYSIKDIEQEILIINDKEQEFAIKLIDKSKIFCEKIKGYMYLVDKEKETNET